MAALQRGAGRCQAPGRTVPASRDMKPAATRALKRPGRVVLLSPRPAQIRLAQAANLRLGEHDHQQT